MPRAVVVDGDLLEPGGEIPGEFTAVIKRGDDVVIGAQSTIIETGAHPVSGVDPELSRNLGISDPAVWANRGANSVMTLSVALMNARSLESAPATGAAPDQSRGRRGPRQVSFFTAAPPRPGRQPARLTRYDVVVESTQMYRS